MLRSSSLNLSRLSLFLASCTLPRDPYLLGLFSSPSSRFFACSSISRSCRLRSYGVTPTRFIVSHTSIVLTRLSKGDDELSEGLTFTSKSHGFSVWSSKISNPYTSKHTCRNFVPRFMWLTIYGSIATRAFMMTSLIDVNTSSYGMPSSSNFCRSILRDHLHELKSSSPSCFAGTYVSAFLFTE